VRHREVNVVCVCVAGFPFRASVLAGLVAALLAVSGCSQSAQEYKVSGDRYFDQKDYARAILEYQNALKINAQLGDVRAKLAEAYTHTGQSVNAMGEYIRAADLLPHDRPLQLLAARAFLASGRFEDAKTRVERVLEEDPRSSEAQGLLGSALIGLKDADGALREIEEAIQLDPTRATSQTALGALKLGRGDLAAAESAFKKAAELSPQSVTPHLSLANFYWWAGRIADAEAAFKSAVALAKADPQVHRSLALFYITTGRAALAEPHLQGLAAASTDRTTDLLLADYYVTMRQRDKGMAILEKAASGSDAEVSASARWRIASLRYADGSQDEAHRLLDEVLRADPKNARALLLKADFLTKERKLDEALARAKAATAAGPEIASAHYALGMVHRARGEVDESIQAFNEALRLNPRAAAAEVALAQMHLLQNSAAKSLQYARDALESNPTSVQARLTLVATLISQGNGVEAETELKPLAAQYPDSPAVHAYLGAANLLRKNDAAARQSFERALKLDPTSSEALAGLVSLDVGQGRVADAKSRIDAALAKAASNPVVLVLAAQVYHAVGDAARAEELLLKVIELDSSNMRAYEMLGGYYISVNRLDAARAQFESLAARRPRDVGAHTMVALLLGAQNRHTEAQARFERILEIDPRAAVAANNLAWIYADGDGNLDRALELAQVAKAALPDDPAVNDTLGWVYYKKNLAQSAIPFLRASVERDGRQPVFHYHLGLAYAKNGEKIPARRALEQALRLSPDFPGAADARRVLATL
jgi:tetratricopeptide (TPR) repeat protein